MKKQIVLIAGILMWGAPAAFADDNEVIPAGKVTNEDFVPITQDAITQDPIDFSEQNQTVGPTEPIVPKGTYTVPSGSNPSGQQNQ